MSANKLLGLRAYARHRGVSLAAVQKAIHSERIPFLEISGQIRIDPILADVAWSKNTRLVSSESTDGSYQASRAQKEHYLAQLAKIEYEEKMGTLLNANETRETIIKLVTETKDALLGIPDRVSPVLVAINDPNELATFLRQEINEALANLSRADSNRSINSDF